MQAKAFIASESLPEMKLPVRLVNLGRLIKRLSHFFRRPDHKITQNISADYKHMRELERIQPYNETYERMRRDGKH